MFTKNSLSLLLLLTLSELWAQGQQCGNCQANTKVKEFDLDVQVPQPNATDSTSDEWLKWKQLFWLGKHANADIFNANNKCITFIQVYDNDVIKVGETATNLVNNGDLSDFTGYLTTGYVKESGAQFLMHMELQAACDRHTVIASDVNFNYSSDPAYIMGIAQQAAAPFLNLADKIRQYEIHQRSQNKKLSINSFASDPIKIVPAKKTLKPGESTDITLELKDCDGTPLEGREISFTATTFKGFKVSGTVGGQITPAKVTTDAEGKAKAKFTLSANAKEAIIKANSIGLDVKGCPDIFIGEAVINIAKSYSGFLTFSYSLDEPECIHTEKPASSIATLSQLKKESVEYKGVFVSKEDPEGSSISLSIGDVEESDDEDIPGSMGTGTYELTQKDMTKEVLQCVCVNNGMETFLKEGLRSSGKLKTGGFSFIIDENGNLTRVTISLTFSMQTTSTANGTMIYPVNETKTEDYDYSIDLDSQDTPNWKSAKHQNGNTTTYSVQVNNDFPGYCPYTTSYRLTLSLQH